MFFVDRQTFFQLGFISIQYYALFIMMGVFVAYMIGQYNFKKHGYDKEILSDFVFYLLPIGILGARLWYVIFMWNEMYADNLAEIVRIDHGGLAIQGGVVAGLIFSYYFFKKRGIDFFRAGDAIMPGVLVAQAFGRWGNFFNQEAHGGEVARNFLEGLHLPNFIIEGMYINGSYYHPTFLYESVLNVIGFLLIFLVVKKVTRYRGVEFFSYFIWYGIIRFFVEGMRTDSLYFLGMRTAQLTSLAFIVVGIGGIVYVVSKNLRRS